MRDAQTYRPARSTFAAMVLAFVIAVGVTALAAVATAGIVVVRQGGEEAQRRTLPLPGTGDDSSDETPVEEAPVDDTSAETVSLRQTQDTTARIGADVAHDEGITGEGWAVVVIDTGVEADHPYLEGRVVHEACFTQFGQCPNGEDAMTGEGAAAPCDSPDCDHGTHVAGIAVGDDGPGGRTGVAPGADLIAIRVFTDERSDVCGSTWCPTAYDEDVIAALAYVRDELADRYDIAAVNLSLGFGRHRGSCDEVQSTYTKQIEALRDLGIATVVSTGNEGYENAVGSPACITAAVSVGAVGRQDVVASWSNTSPQLDLVAPGDGVVSSSGSDDYVVYSGTSMAAPHVTGAWALLRSAGVDGDVDDVLALLQSSGVEARDPRNGAMTCRIDVAVALDLEEDPDGEPCEPRVGSADEATDDSSTGGQDRGRERPGRPELPGRDGTWG